MRPEEIAAFVLLIALATYILTGGADFGAGFWELVFSRRRNSRFNSMISSALAPIWEANHVWLIFAVVLIAAAFPKAFAIISISLSTPLLLMLIGISLRGAAFAFRRYGPPDERFQSRWGFVFSVSSSVTPFFLGITMGAAVSGSIQVPGGRAFPSSDPYGWLSPFPLAVGLFTFVICAFLSTIYLASQARDQEIAETFRRLSIWTSISLDVVAGGVLLVSRAYAPFVFARLTSHVWSWQLHTATAILSVLTLALLLTKSVRRAQVAAVLQVFAIIFGLGLAQYPFIVAPDLTIYNAAAPASSIRVFLVVTAVGLGLIAPAFAYLYWVFLFGPQRLGRAK